MMEMLVMGLMLETRVTECWCYLTGVRTSTAAGSRDK